MHKLLALQPRDRLRHMSYVCYNFNITSDVLAVLEAAGDLSGNVSVVRERVMLVCGLRDLREAGEAMRKCFISRWIHIITHIETSTAVSPSCNTPLYSPRPGDIDLTERGAELWRRLRHDLYFGDLPDFGCPVRGRFCTGAIEEWYVYFIRREAAARAKEWYLSQHTTKAVHLIALGRWMKYWWDVYDSGTCLFVISTNFQDVPAEVLLAKKP